MAHANRIIWSWNQNGGHLCVDVFQRPDGTYGFGEFRRDPEDTRGWYDIGGYANLVYSTPQDAKSAAMAQIGWFTDQVEGPDCPES